MMITQRQTELRSRLKTLGRVAIAFSAGVDSAFLLRESVLSGAITLALTAKSAFSTAAELIMAQRVAQMLGVEHEFIEIDVFSAPEVIANPLDRCYLCKRLIMGALKARAEEKGYTLCDGTNKDDLGAYRPGLKALKELDVLSPLAQLGFTKDEIRLLSDGLPTKDQPSNACLATRIPSGTPITPETLGMIERSEARLNELGFVGVRVRTHGDIARIEWSRPYEIVQRADECVSICEEAGFRLVCLDLKGYRTGGANA